MPQSPSPAEISALVALYDTGRYAELENRACALVDQYPYFGFGWKLLSSALQKQGKHALSALQKTSELMPEDADAHYNLGVVQNSLGLFTEAAESYRRALKARPDDAGAYYNLAIVLKLLGQSEMAATSYRKVVEIKPDFAEAHNNLGNVLKDLGQLEAAAASYRRALQIKPDYAEAHNNLGHVLQALGQPDAALASCQRALEIKPDFAEAYNNLGNAQHDLGDSDAAMASYRRALEIEPDFAVAHSNLLFCLSHSEAVDAQTLFAEHCCFGEQFEAPLRAAWPEHGNSRDPQRTLQVGFVSGDLRHHVIAYFIEPVLAHLSDYPQLSLHGYYNHTVEDAVNQRLRGYLTHWHPVAGLPDDALAEQIRADGIDILIDLSGHTGKNRLLTFARKPAPVQASWMGYPGTTGLSAMDYYLADPFFLPPGQYDNQFTEKLVYLPASAPFLPSPAALAVNALPALDNGYLTFGSFNRLGKIGRPVIALWAQLLRALPDSRMLLAGLPEEGKYGTLIDWFAQEGITPERMDFHVRSDMQRYLGLHHQVDICRDTYPYTGGTTTLHALWMGAPTLTIAGRTAAGRQGAAILGHAGLERFVARDAADFVQKGLSWAGDLAALSAIRAGLRERFAQSAMGQPALVAAGLERALRLMWQRWCKGLPPAAIDASDHTTHRINEIS